MAGLCPLFLYFACGALFPPKRHSCSKGLDLRQSEPVIARSVGEVETEQLSAGRRGGGVEDGAPCGGTVSSHSPPPQAFNLKEASICQSVRGMGLQPEWWAGLGILVWWEPGPGRSG